MAYGKLAEGNRIWDSSLDLGVYFEDFNETNDQLKGMLGPRKIEFGMTGVCDGTNAAWNSWYRYSTGGLEMWRDYTDNGAVLYIPTPLYVGQKITEIGCTVSGDAGATAGQCLFVYLNQATGAGATIDLDAVANCWDTSGVQTSYTDTTPLTITANYTYQFYFQAASNAATPKNCYVHNAWVIAQFGN